MASVPVSCFYCLVEGGETVSERFAEKQLNKSRREGPSYLRRTLGHTVLTPRILFFARLDPSHCLFVHEDLESFEDTGESD